MTYSYDYPTGDAGRLWRRGVELGQGWTIIGDKKCKISLLGEKQLDRQCGCCGCHRVYVIRVEGHPTHYAKFQCTKCAHQVKWASKSECEFK